MYLGPTSVAFRAVGVTVGGGCILGPTSAAFRAVGVTVGGGCT